MSRAIDRGRTFELLRALSGVPKASWPTPVSGASRTGGIRAFDGGAFSRQQLEDRVGREQANEMQHSPNPAWVEWLMGFPMGWTESALPPTGQQ